MRALIKTLVKTSTQRWKSVGLTAFRVLVLLMLCLWLMRKNASVLKII